MRFSRAELDMLDATGDLLRERNGGQFSRTGTVRWFLSRFILPTGDPDKWSRNERLVVEARQQLREEES